MSHINDALKKAQEEKDSLYQRYKKLISSRHHKKNTKKAKRKVTRVTVSILLALILVSFVLYYVFSDTHLNKSASPESTKIKKVLAPLKKTTDGPKIPVAKSHDVRKAAVPAEKTSTLPVKMAGDSKKPAKTYYVKLLYQQALNYQQKNDLTRADNIYRKILDTDPNHVSALNNLGVIYMVRKQNGKAIQAFTKAINLKSDYVDPYYNLACLYSQSGNTSKSLKYLKKAIKIKNDVKNWAINDTDLRYLHTSNEFRKIVGQPSKVSEEKNDIYIVKKGEWIFDIIRRKYGASDEEISGLFELTKSLNPGIEDTNIIHSGQKLVLPKAAKPQGQSNEQ
jgi:tetratricopeptide (TPR) repeat protein